MDFGGCHHGVKRHVECVKSKKTGLWIVVSICIICKNALVELHGKKVKI